MLLRPSALLARRLSCAAVAAAFGATAVAQPTGLTKLHGDAVVEQSGSTTRVTTTNGAGTRHSAFDWRSFSVPSGTTTHFQQPGADSTSINRVTGNNPSSIFGTLSSNGRLVLVNPAGIAVGAQGLVDTAGFTASTLGMTRGDAIAGTLRFGGTGALEDFEGGGGSQRITVNGGGTIRAVNGDVVLVAPRLDIESGAVVEAIGGDVVLAAGRTVGITGRGLEGIVMELRAPDDEAINLGTLRGDSVAIFAGQLRHSGLIQAHSATSSGGKVVLDARTPDDPKGRIEIEGRIEASRSLRGGIVEAFADDRLRLKGSAVIDVSHAAGGGEIILTAGDRLEGDQGVELRVAATLSGTPGNVRLVSPDTDFKGRIVRTAASSGSTGSSGSDDDDNNNSGSSGSGSGSGNSGSGSTGSANSGSASSGNGGNGGNSGNGSNNGTAAAPPPAQPRLVQAAVRQTDTEVDNSLERTLAALASGPEDPYERKVVVDAVSCAVTR